MVLTISSLFRCSKKLFAITMSIELSDIILRSIEEPMYVVIEGSAYFLMSGLISTAIFFEFVSIAFINSQYPAPNSRTTELYGINLKKNRI